MMVFTMKSTSGMLAFMFTSVGRLSFCWMRRIMIDRQDVVVISV